MEETLSKTWREYVSSRRADCFVFINHFINYSAGTKVYDKLAEESIAIKYKDLKEMGKKDFRKIFTGKKLIYIYHNSIDDRGDHGATYREVFNAVDEIFKELRNLVNDLINNVSASNIFITASHGFIYKRGNLT